jgi:hypothetical protein
MNIKSLTLKNTLIDDTTGESYYDLTAPTFRYLADYGVRSIHYVTQDQEARIDLIADLYYGTTEYVDALCIVNNIFNPFSLKEGDVIVIPDMGGSNSFYSRPTTQEKANQVQSQFTDVARQSQKDQARIQRILQKAKTKKSGVKTPLPPNVLQPGQSAKTYTGGNIQLGTNLPSQTTT